MSEVAVKIYETKREVHRIYLASPLYGKDGTEQQGKWLNADTGKEVNQILLQRRGRYQIIAVLHGKDIQNIAGPQDIDENFKFLVENIKKNSDTKYYSMDTFLCRTNNFNYILSSLNGFFLRRRYLTITISRFGI